MTGSTIVQFLGRVKLFEYLLKVQFNSTIKMTDVMREMIAQLMGQQRAEEEGRRLPPFDHHSVCRAYLLGCCPRDLLSDTRLESMMSCRKLHEPAHKGEFNRSQEQKDLFYDIEAFEELEDAIRIVDSDIRRLQDKVKRDAEQNMDISEQQRTQKIFEMNEKIGMALVQEVDELKRKKRELEGEMRNINPATMQRLRVCEACGAQLNIMDHESRLQDHYGGKMHLGMVEIREHYAEMKRRSEKRRTDDKDRDERRRRSGREDERERDRKRDRSRSRSRSRKHRRSRSRDRTSKSSRRSRSRDRRRH
uniref:Luc7-like protein 3 n=1 Tax=Globodera rostochiensis TaxID=31243 RepID=A0A914I883_GLORO